MKQGDKISKLEFVEKLAKDTGLSKTDAARAIESFIEQVTKALARGKKVTLTGFGTFSMRRRAARTGRNPQTNETIKIAASNVPAFKPGKGLRDRLN